MYRLARQERLDHQGAQLTWVLVHCSTFIRAMLIMTQFLVTAQRSFQTLVMLLATFLVPYVVLATKAVAGPTVIRNSISRISFPISRHFVHRNETGPFQELSKNSVNEVERRSSSTPKLVCNDTGLAYAISIGVGDPPTFCEYCQLPKWHSFLNAQSRQPHY